MTYIKLNNHAQRAQGQVAYYDNPMSLSPYQSEPCQRLIVSTRGRSQTNPHLMTRNFAELRPDDLILIFQSFKVNHKSKTRVITHVLEVTGRPIADGLSGQYWSHGNIYRHSIETRVLARLAPIEFSGYYGHDTPSIYARDLPKRSISMLDLGFKTTPQNGDVYKSFGGQQVDRERLEQKIKSNGGYELCERSHIFGGFVPSPY